eukprot:57403-Pelagomonas_calceolata.AAC.3
MQPRGKRRLLAAHFCTQAAAYSFTESSRLHTHTQVVHVGWNTVEKRVMEFANSNMGEMTVAGFEAFAQGLEEEKVRAGICICFKYSACFMAA